MKVSARSPGTTGGSPPGWLAALVLLVLITGCGSLQRPIEAIGPDGGGIPPHAVPGARSAPFPIPATFIVPPGKDPFPVVIVLHGCSGRGPSQLTWASRLIGWGYAVLIPDSMTARGVK